VVAVAVTKDGAIEIVTAIVSALFALAGAIAAAAIAFGSGAYRAIGENRAGICSGHASVHPNGEPPLTPWLASLVDTIAGKPANAPLTFRDLRERGIELAMMTTSLTHGRPYRLPFDRDVFFFAEREMEALFPKEIVASMVGAAKRALF